MPLSFEAWAEKLLYVSECLDGWLKVQRVTCSEAKTLTWLRRSADLNWALNGHFSSRCLLHGRAGVNGGIFGFHWVSKMGDACCMISRLGRVGLLLA